MLNVQRIAWPLIVVVALSAGAVWHVATAQEKVSPGVVPNGVLAVQPKALPDVQKWEYKMYHLQGWTSDEREKILNSFGMEGWELVAVVQQGNDLVAYLKRRK